MGPLEAKYVALNLAYHEREHTNAVAVCDNYDHPHLILDRDRHHRSIQVLAGQLHAAGYDRRGMLRAQTLRQRFRRWLDLRYT